MYQRCTYQSTVITINYSRYPLRAISSGGLLHKHIQDDSNTRDRSVSSLQSWHV